MTSDLIFQLIIAIILFSFIVDRVLSHLNAKRFNTKVPELLNGIYDSEDYKKSQAYKAENYRLELLSSTFSILTILLFLSVEGFKHVDSFARSITTNTTAVTLVFFAVILFASDIISTPFSYYKTFVIEEKYGFNKTTRLTFLTDKLKSWMLLAVIGGLILTALTWFYQTTGNQFWIYAWCIIIAFSIFANLFYAQLIVPVFNKQKPLEDGPLRHSISAYAKTVGFSISNIFIIDGSKRSTKANAYFSGFGKQKRITLFDTLLSELNSEEIIAVIAHEVGHYKKHHIVYNFAITALTTGFMLYLLSLFISSPTLSNALGISEPNFHIGLIAFGLLYSPISEIIGLGLNYISRLFEYQADNYAKQTYNSNALATALKKLSKTSFSNLTPHPAYVFANYSHPTLLQRLTNLTA